MRVRRSKKENVGRGGGSGRVQKRGDVGDEIQRMSWRTSLSTLTLRQGQVPITDAS